MKISELIRQLFAAKETYGDVEIHARDSDDNLVPVSAVDERYFAAGNRDFTKVFIDTEEAGQ